MQSYKPYAILLLMVFVLFMFVRPVICFILLGIVIIAIAVVAILQQLRMNRKGILCYAAIVDYEGEDTPVFEFTTVAGELIRGKLTTHIQLGDGPVWPKQDQLPASVIIKYDPDKPERFLLAPGGYDNGNEILFAFIGVIGVAAIIFGICSLLGYINI